MTENKWGFPLIIVTVLIVTSLLTVLVPNIVRGVGVLLSGAGSSEGAPVSIPSEPSEFGEVTLDVDGYLLGEELVKIPALGEYSSLDVEERTYSSLSILAIITAIVVGGLIAFTIPIAGLVYLGSRSVNNSLDDTETKAKSAALENKLKEHFKEENKIKPMTPKPAHYRPRRDAYAAAGIVLFMAYFFGYVMGEGVSAGSGSTIGLIAFIFALIGSYFYFRPARIEAVDGTEYGSINYGTVWVALSGALMMGIGVGLMYIVMSGGDPLPWVDWSTGAPRVDWTFFRDWFVDAGLRPQDWN
ncbi:MAG: hypothetical protein AAF902_20905 [Chloroflexota bacterium]